MRIDAWIAVSLGVAASAVALGCNDGEGGGPADGGPMDASDGSAGDATRDGASPDAGGPRDWPAMEVPASTSPAPGVRRDVVRVAGVTPPPNPATGDETPQRLNATQVLRYRVDADPPVAAHAIVVAMPGFLGGGGSFAPLARTLVQRSDEAGTPIEVWAIDRRSNLMEDLRGMDAAEAAGDPRIARGYYFGEDTVGGEAFEGFKTQDEVAFESEWGLATHVGDLRAVIAEIPEAQRQARVFLMGHSLGASFAEAYAAWRFEDGTRGFEELAGLVLLDGVLGSTPTDEMTYRQGGGSGLTASPGLQAIRQDTRYFALPVLGVEVLPQAEVLALRALQAPDEVIADPLRDEVLRLLLGYSAGELPELTNRAAFSVGFDDQSTPVSFAASSLGEPAGGPTEEFTGLLGEPGRRPSDAGATYSWTDALDTDPPEFTPVDNLASAFVHGRSNFGEWYFPMRLTLDLDAVGGASVPEDGWQADLGLRAFDGEDNGAPILAVAAGLVEPSRYDPLRDRVASQIGTGRPMAGTPRSDAAAFRVIDATDMAHLDPVSAADVDHNPVPGAIMELIDAHAEAGTVQIDAL